MVETSLVDPKVGFCFIFLNLFSQMLYKNRSHV